MYALSGGRVKVPFIAQIKLGAHKIINTFANGATRFFLNTLLSCLKTDRKQKYVLKILLFFLIFDNSCFLKMLKNSSLLNFAQKKGGNIATDSERNL